MREGGFFGLGIGDWGLGEMIREGVEFWILDFGFEGFRGHAHGSSLRECV